MYHVLYVDDEPELLELGKLFLETSEEFAIDTATSAKDALATQNISMYDAIIADYQMPEMNGIEFLKEVRSRFSDIPFILFTGRGREEVVIEAINNGADFYLQKGGDPKSQFIELAHKIRMAVGKRESEKNLREVEQRYRNVVENQTEFISRFLPDGTHIFVNEAYCRYFHKERGEILGKKFRAEIPKEDQCLVRNHFASLTITHPTATIEHRIIMPDGQVRWQRWSDRAIFDPGGRVIEYQSVGRDVTEKRCDEEALKESRERLAFAIEGAHLGLWDIDYPNRTISHNQYWNEVLGDEGIETETPLNSWVSRIHPEDFLMVRMMFQDHLDGKTPMIDTEYRVRHSDGSWVWIRTLGKVVRYDAHNQPIRLSGINQNITERKMAEKELIEREAYYRTIFENTGTASLIIDEDMTISLANAEFADLSGYPREELEGKKHWTEFVLQEDQDRMIGQHHLRRRDRLKAERHYEFRFQRKNGEIRTILLSIDLIPNTTKSIASLLDITESRKAEAELRKSEKKFRMLAENINDIHFSATSEGIITYIGPQVRVLGYSPNEILSRQILDFIYPADREAGARTLSAFSETGVSSLAEFRVVDKWGNIHWMQENTTRIKDSSGRVTGFSGILRDITGRKEAEEALRWSEKRYRNIIENMQDVVYQTDQEGRLIMVSPHGAKLLGYDSAEELLGLDVALDIYKNPPERERFLAALKEKGSVENYPIVLKTRDGNSRFGTTSSHFYHDERGNVLGVEGVIHDITEQRQAEEALRRANRQLNLMTSITRHDINNKISAALGYLSIAELKFTDPALQNYLGKMESAVKMIQSLIAGTRIYQDLGMHEPQWQDVEKCLPVPDIPPTITLHAEVKGIEIFADPMLDRVFFNLLDNSIRHGDHVTRIRVSSSQSADGLTIIWEDNGAGIAPGQKKKIFKQGFGKNTGLGLFLVQEILALTGIMIKETGTEGSGVRFEMLVPEGAYRFRG